MARGDGPAIDVKTRTEMSIPAAARALGIGERTLYRYRARGYFGYSSRGRVNLEEIRRRLADAGVELGVGPGRPPGPEPAVTFAEAERRRMLALAERVELEVRVKRGRLVDRQAAERRVVELDSAEQDRGGT